MIEKSRLFDSEYYLKHNYDAKISSAIPIDHFCKTGLKEDRKPNEEFDPVWYREYYADVKEDGGHPFIHYIIYGLKEGRFQNESQKNKVLERTNSAFDEDSYLKANPDVKLEIENKNLKNALEHFNLSGRLEVAKGERRLGIEFPLFSEVDYIEANEDIKMAVKNDLMDSPIEHFFEIGYKEYLNGLRKLGGFYPFELTDELLKNLQKTFDEDAYLSANEDIKKKVDDGIVESGWKYFIEHGIKEIREGKKSICKELPPISESDYVLSNHDIFNALKRGDIVSPFEHFLAHGVSEYLNGTRKVITTRPYTYSEAPLSEEIKEEIKNFDKKPLISVIMPVYNVDSKWLKLAIESLKNQWYSHWELCIADDASTKDETVSYLKSLDDVNIKVVYLEKNLNISGASNAAISLATGEYVALLDNDDELTPDALYEVVKTINENNAEFIYSDEDFLTINGQYTNPHFKPDFSPDLLLSHNYITHFTCFKKSLIDKAGAFRSECDGAQDFDLFLRLTEMTENIYHIPKVLYHWRMIETSTSNNSEAKPEALDNGKRAVENALERRALKGRVEKGNQNHYFKVEYEILDNPLVSIVIPFKDEPELLDMCINSILDKSTYQNYEIIGISNNSKESKTFKMMEKLKKKDERVFFYEYNVPFNYSQINNYGVNECSKGEQVLLLNNDIEIITPEWIEHMLAYSQRDDVGAVGAKLYYPNDSIQHAGVIIGIGGVAGHSHKHFFKDHIGYFNRLKCVQNISAVTAACLMIKKTIFKEVNGLNEKDLKVAFNDVDFCLRVRESGYKNVFTPYAEAYHYESVSRGYEDSPEKIKRFKTEESYMKKRHSKILKDGDPYYNVNLTLENEKFNLK